MVLKFICILLCFESLHRYAIAHDVNKNSYDVIPEIPELDSTSISKNIIKLAATDCDCGKNSNGCQIVNDKKICNCENGFVQGASGNCVEACTETKLCKNGGSCLQHLCVCLPGTLGDFCQIIKDCQRQNLCVLDGKTRCSYDVTRQKAYCECSVTEHRFDEATKSCQDCLCTETFHQDLRSFSYCEYQQGQKVCTCTEKYAYNPDTQFCEMCDCGINSTWCGFEKNGDKVCGCQEGSFFTGYGCKECACGTHGTCNPSLGFPYCACDEGYVEHEGVCVECSCGKYGECIYDENMKQTDCKCNIGYAEKSEKCEKCYCGDNMNCTFAGSRKLCTCDFGYEDHNGFCNDINECEKHNPCEDSMYCINLPGSFECICKEGFKSIIIETVIMPVLACQDIDECQNSSSCSQADTFCENVRGSFKCICKSGSVSRGMVNSNPLCEASSATSIYTVIGITSFICIFIIGAVVYYIKKTFKENCATNQHELK